MDLRLGVRIDAITTSDGTPIGARLSDGTTIEADAIVVGVGAAPDLTLAESAGLDLDNGVLVDASLRTSDPAIYAVGDIANHDHPVFGHRMQGRALGHRAQATRRRGRGPARPAHRVHRTALLLQRPVRLGHGIRRATPRTGFYDQVVVRGDLASREFVAFWLADGRIKAAMTVNVWDVVESIKPRITAGWGVNAVRLADPSVPYEAL